MPHENRKRGVGPYLGQGFWGNDDPSVTSELRYGSTCVFCDMAVEQDTADHDAVFAFTIFASQQCLQLHLINVPVLYDLLYKHPVLGVCVE